MTRKFSFAFAVLFLVGGTAASAKSGSQASPPQTARKTTQPDSAPDLSAHRALLDQYCITCHNQRLKTAGLTLDTADITNISAQSETWEKVIRKVRAEMMPPVGAAHPDKAALDALATYLETSLDKWSATHPNPGRPTLHRLNRAEYGNAVRDLFALDAIDIMQFLPPDPEAYGFDNIADSLGTSPALMERYLSVAWKITRMAVGNTKIPATTETFPARMDLTQRDHIEGLPLGTRGGMAIQHNFPVDAEYEIRPKLWANTVEQIGGLEHPDTLEITFDGERIKLVNFGGHDDEVLAAGVSATARAEIEGRFVARIPVKAGPHTIGVAFLKKSSAPPVDVLRPFLRDRIDPVSTNGIAQLDKIVIEGPFNVTGSGDSPSRRRILICRPSNESETLPCANKILSTVARRAYRRPVTDAELKQLMGFFQSGREKGGSFESGIETALAFILVSPQFLFRFEKDPEGIAAGATYRVSDLELASRLSFFIWSSVPDDQLQDLAVKGRLKDPAVLDAQVKRMLADERARALGTNFAGQWLYLRNLKAKYPIDDIFPDFDDNLRRAMQRETEMLFESVVLEDRSALTLLDADYTFMNERLAKHYGVQGIYGDQMRRVSVRDEYRKGLLGHASVLTLTSNDDRTNPVSRGKYVLTNLLGTPPPPPPPNVPPLNELSGRTLSMRERMQEHRANAVCANCHRLMDPIGLSLENFDGTGRWRTTDGGVAIDAHDTLYNGAKVDGPVSLRKVILGHPDQFVRTMTEMLLTYALGRGLEDYDMPVVRSIVRDAAKKNYAFSSLVLGIVRSAPFQMRLKKLQETDSKVAGNNSLDDPAVQTSATSKVNR
jgi:mono/diheme cytochrome c family protein